MIITNTAITTLLVLNVNGIRDLKPNDFFKTFSNFSKNKKKLVVVLKSIYAPTFVRQGQV